MKMVKNCLLTKMAEANFSRNFDSL